MGSLNTLLINQFWKHMWGEKGKEEGTSETADCISPKKRISLFCRKTLFTPKHKTLKKSKKKQKGNNGLLCFFCGEILDSHFRPKVVTERTFFSDEVIDSYFRPKVVLKAFPCWQSNGFLFSTKSSLKQLFFCLLQQLWTFTKWQQLFEKWIGDVGSVILLTNCGIGDRWSE